MRIPCTFNHGNLGAAGDEPGLLINTFENNYCHVVDAFGRIALIRNNQVRVNVGNAFTRSITAAVKKP